MPAEEPRMIPAFKLVEWTIGTSKMTDNSPDVPVLELGYCDVDLPAAEAPRSFVFMVLPSFAAQEALGDTMYEGLPDPVQPDFIAQNFHESYERLAPAFGYKTREASAVPWDQVPSDNKHLMIRVIEELLERGVIRAGRPDLGSVGDLLPGVDSTTDAGVPGSSVTDGN